MGTIPKRTKFKLIQIQAYGDCYILYDISFVLFCVLANTSQYLVVFAVCNYESLSTNPNANRSKGTQCRHHVKRQHGVNIVFAPCQLCRHCNVDNVLTMLSLHCLQWFYFFYIDIVNTVNVAMSTMLTRYRVNLHRIHCYTILTCCWYDIIQYCDVNDNDEISIIRYISLE
jgi:hypothetical protein